MFCLILLRRIKNDCFPLSITFDRLFVLDTFSTCIFPFFHFKRGPFLALISTVFKRCLLRQLCLSSMLLDMELNFVPIIMIE